MLYEIALSFIPNIGARAIQNLVAYCGSAEGVFSSPKTKLLKVPGIGEERASSIIHHKHVLQQAEEELKFISDYNIQPLFYTSEKFPQRLKDCTDMPAMLFYKGNTDLNATKVLGIVGTRNITDYGKEMVKKVVQDLQDSGILVVSGLAYGVDIQAHQAALDLGLPTVGVLGHGLNQIYPQQHRSTAKRMVEQGGLLTEYTSQDKFTPHNFPTRNRIVAGMCDAIVVVESAMKGGAVITANIANSYNRDVFAVPGKITDKFSAGCNFLLKTYKAQIIESGKDILDAMLWEQADTKKQKSPKQSTMPLSKDEQKIYCLLQEQSDLEIDKIAVMTEMNPGKLAGILLEMEMSEIIVSLPGKRYKLVG